MSEHEPNIVALSLAEAASALGLTTEAVRTRIKRGRLESRKGNDGRTLVLVPRSQLETALPQHGLDKDGTASEPASILKEQLDRALSERDQARLDMEVWRTKAEEERLGRVRAETERDAARSEQKLIERELERARRPWWRRLLEG